MPKWALLLGGILLGLGLYGYLGADSASTKPADGVAVQAGAEGATASPATAAEAPAKSNKTALIPAFFGIALVLCGTLGLMEGCRKHAMHIAAAVAALGFLLAGGRVAMTIPKILDGSMTRAGWFVLAMAVICALYVVLSVMSFRQARMAREAGSKIA